MTRRRTRRLWQAALLCCGAAALLAGRPALAQQTTNNRYLRTVVDQGSHRFTIIRGDGDPLTNLDDNLNLLFFDQEEASKVTILLGSNVSTDADDLEFIYGADGEVVADPTLSADGRSITSSWAVPSLVPAAEGRSVIVTQRVSLVRDLVCLEYTIENRGVPRSVGIRVAVDPALTLLELTPAASDHDESGLPFFVPKQGFFGFETNFTAGTVPDSWFGVDDLTNPTALVRGVLTGLNATRPDRVIFAGHIRLVEDDGGLSLLPDWDHVVNPFQTLLGLHDNAGDGSVAAFFGPRPLGTLQKRTIRTYIGTTNASHGLAGPVDNPFFVGAAQTPLSQPMAAGAAADFTLTASAMNLRNTVGVNNVNATIGLPEGLELAPGQTLSVLLGSLEPFLPASANAERSVSWTLHANGERTGVLPINVVLSTPAQGTTNVRHEISVPQGTEFRIRTQYQMVTFPFLLADAVPEVVFGIPSSEFDLLIFDPVINEYVRADVIEPGRSYWLRRVGGAGDITVTLSGATPIDTSLGGTETEILRGWNMVGNASPYAALLQDVLFTDPVTGDVVNFKTALSRRLIRGSVWRYDRFQRKYIALGASDFLSPGEGIWIFADRPLTIQWPAPHGIGIQVS